MTLTACITPDHERWNYGYDPFGRRVWKVKVLTEQERIWCRGKYPALVDPASIPERGVHYLTPVEPEPAYGGPDPDRRERPPVVGIAYAWDGYVIAEEAPLRLDGAIDWERATRWHYEPGSFQPLAKETPDGTLLYIVTDHLGTPREMMSVKGELVWAAQYSTWGKLREVRVPKPANDDNDPLAGWRPGGTGGIGTYPNGGGGTRGNLALQAEEAAFDCPIRFQGQYEDAETGLYYNRFRHYDPLAAQYVSSDPVGLAGGERSHGYVHTPLTYVDLFGLNTAPKLPPSLIVREGGVTIEHYYHGNDHLPAHAHVKGEGSTTRIGANGKPLKCNPELSSQQARIVKRNLSQIRSKINKINRYFKLQNHPPGGS